MLPRILDEMRAFITNHGGLRLNGIFQNVPDQVTCHSIKQQINRTHSLSLKASPQNMQCVARLIMVKRPLT
jgi:hypothetical protein